MSSTILTTREVQKHGLIGENVNLGVIRPHVAPFEQSFARKVIGHPFYQVLLDDMIDADRNADTYDQAKTYSTGDVVDFYGINYKSTTDNNNESPKGSGWELSKRFEDDEYNSLFTGHLLPYLCAGISARVFPHLEPVGDLGLMKKTSTDDDPNRSATQSENAARLNQIKATANNFLEGLYYYILFQKNQGVTKYDKCLIVTNPERVRRHFEAPRRRFYFQNKRVSGGVDRAIRDIERDY